MEACIAQVTSVQHLFFATAARDRIGFENARSVVLVGHPHFSTGELDEIIKIAATLGWRDVVSVDSIEKAIQSHYTTRAGFDLARNGSALYRQAKKKLFDDLGSLSLGKSPIDTVLLFDTQSPLRAILLDLFPKASAWVYWNHLNKSRAIINNSDSDKMPVVKSVVRNILYRTIGPYSSRILKSWVPKKNISGILDCFDWYRFSEKQARYPVFSSKKELKNIVAWYRRVAGPLQSGKLLLIMDSLNLGFRAFEITAKQRECFVRQYIAGIKKLLENDGIAPSEVVIKFHPRALRQNHDDRTLFKKYGFYNFITSPIPAFVYGHEFEQVSGLISTGLLELGILYGLEVHFVDPVLFEEKCGMTPELCRSILNYQSLQSTALEQST